jgi:hypothetical protein
VEHAAEGVVSRDHPRERESSSGEHARGGLVARRDRGHQAGDALAEEVLDDGDHGFGGEPLAPEGREEDVADVGGRAGLVEAGIELAYEGAIAGALRGPGQPGLGAIGRSRGGLSVKGGAGRRGRDGSPTCA